MCGGHGTSNAAAAPGSCTALVPDPTETLVAQNLPDGYWLEAFYFHKDDKYPDLIGYGLGFAEKPATITHFINPKNSASGATGWLPVPIQTMDFPVAMTVADLTGDGFNDIVICDRYGPNMDDLWDAKAKDGGRVQWLRNPGGDRSSAKNWAAQRIGNSTAMHRLKVGHFSTKSHLQVLAIPVIAGSGDRTSPAPVIVYTPEYSSQTYAGPSSWKEQVVFANEFRLIHDIKVVPGRGGALDTALVAGREGIVHLYFDKSSVWRYVVIGTGLPQEQGNPYWGSGSVDVGAVHDDPVGYIATCEAFHGNVVSVYVKKPGAPKGVESLYNAANWKRIQIDSYGPLNEEHTGTIHHVVTGDFDGVGVDAFGIACMGAPIGTRASSHRLPIQLSDEDFAAENEGVYVYRPTSLSEGKFHKSKVTDRSAGRLAVSAFNGATLDIASISYFVPGYHTGPECPSIRINANPFFSPASDSDIRVHRLDKEVLLLLPRPSAVAGSNASLPLISVAGRRLHIVVLPPNGTAKFAPKDAVKVMSGEIVMKDSGGKDIKRGLAPERHKAATTQILSKDGTVTAGSAGAVFMRLEYLSDHFQGPYRTMADLPIANAFPNSVPLDIQALQFPFIKVDQLPWASSGNWDGFEFYNMTGFHVFFGDGAMDKICHIQLWTLGLYETARFHIHDTIPFCEIHCCISNGGGTGGMRWFPDDVKEIDQNLELDGKYVDEHTARVDCPSLFEHGPLWKVQDGFRAKPKLLSNGCADYPWHAWLASKFGEKPVPVKPPVPASEQAYDVWLAFEFPLSSFQY
ncbi:hypothetical protein AURDEDRAFT_154969 [Auricularia subglabra TFB-10046 SS5]|uniref:Uncharacterized protein n=1 Tax=Auricularia subglabra (strain TFB-10046 / SS5) TaxID=717982 RepID=J0CWG4_AURST|nr:hypothetical protein AURDEDRAFT_154969 [Auricularia subglabra TFB-10046 SS5]